MNSNNINQNQIPNSRKSLNDLFLNPQLYLFGVVVGLGLLMVINVYSKKGSSTAHLERKVEEITLPKALSRSVYGVEKKDVGSEWKAIRSGGKKVGGELEQSNSHLSSPPDSKSVQHK